ncbi:DUF2098 domain-containing protein [Methanocaldococcus fervens]|uniref:DUF2098 domain-containing protein n=1 Tax=Methanocaldococcus fervens (strain DSM 4213 / JCM 15782 / AG86) TaxID=573064 RepID=C7P656_METFA|nr:DUF2098 domain-containing protein [Methanocaldococcus fervens]ACV24038.1 Protein of unknown function DUF2098 [Methanocaldococcus fervens AG86]
MGEIDIKVGDYVVYINTGTKGKVVDIKKDENGEVWVLLDNNLMYRPHLLKVIDKSKIEERREDIDEVVKKLEEEELEDGKLKDIDLGEACGAG